MILIDANLLIYAYNSSSEYHKKSLKWFENAVSDVIPVRLGWVTILAFVRISTNHKMFKTPLSIKKANSIVDEWLNHPNIDILTPTIRHWEILSKVLTDGQVNGPLVMDAHLAALAIEHGAKIYTNDKDFKRFDGLDVIYPLD